MLKEAKFYVVFILVFAGSVATAQERGKSAKPIKDAVSCNEFAQSTKEVLGQLVGVEQCHIISEETVFNIKGHRFRRVELRLSGGVEGWASREKGSRAIYFTDGPDFVLAQSGLTGPRARGVGRYEATTGHGMTILYPEDGKNWNGKLFITAHGAGSYGAVGALIPRDPNSKFNPLTGNQSLYRSNDRQGLCGGAHDEIIGPNSRRCLDHARRRDQAQRLQSQLPRRPDPIMETTRANVDRQTNW
jgi:hypothetical protein